MYFFKDYILEKFGRPLYRIPIDIPLSCPHREKNGGKGCIFCSENGARARHLKNNLNLREQVSKGIEYTARRYGKNIGYIAYFQSFTNTNADLHTLKKYYSEVLQLANFKMVIIATRPDCLPDDVLDYLSALNRECELWVELGVQTANDRTLELINRQHDFACVKNAVKKLSEHGLKTAAHVILGLPGEGIREFRNTAERIAALPFSAVKIHNLLVLKNTPLAKEYAKGKFRVMNEYEYAEILMDFLRYIPKNWPLMRISADADPQEIIAPKWWMKKGQFIEYVRMRMRNTDSLASAMPKVRTNDGSFTFYHPEYREHFHTIAGAKTEALKKFIEPCEIRSRLKNLQSLEILDIGFGLGYNSLSAVTSACEIQGGIISISSLEKDRKALEIALLVFDESSLEYEIISTLIKKKKWENEFAGVKIIFGDARQSIQKLKGPFDTVFLDPFSHGKNPELWSYDFIRKLRSLMKNDGIIATYSSAYPVRGALLRCDLNLGETPAFGRKRGGTIACANPAKIINPLSEKELGIIRQSTAGTAYRDPYLNWDRDKILKFRKKIMEKLREKEVPRWYKPKSAAFVFESAI